MAMIDRRFLDVRLVVEGYDDGTLVKEVLPIGADDPDNPGTPLTAEKTINYTPIKGMQFIVKDADASGAFAGKADNMIAICTKAADGGNPAEWKFVAPQEGNMELLFLRDKYDDTGAALAEERSNVFKKWVANGAGGNFVKVLDLPSAENLETVNDNIVDFIKDADTKIRKMVKEYDNEITEVIELDADDIAAKKVVLSEAVETGKEGAVRAFVSGVVLANGADHDFEITTATIQVDNPAYAPGNGKPEKIDKTVGALSWADKELEGILIEGDVFTVIYEGPSTRADADYELEYDPDNNGAYERPSGDPILGA